MQATKHPTESTVTEIVEDLIQDWGLDDVDVDGDTLLVEHLDFASVDIIQLCVALEQHYGRKLRFQELLMVNGKYVSDLRIRDFADFIVKRLAER